MWVYFALFLSMIFVVTGELLIKKGVTVADLSPTPLSVLQTFFSPYVFTGFLMYCFSGVLWMFILKKLPISVAYPTISITYVIIIFAGYFFFGEPLTVNKIVGAFIILTGVTLLFY